MRLSHSIELFCVRAFRLGIAVALCTGLAGGAALAAGDRDDAPEPRPNATATQYQTAKTAIEQERYAVAIPILEEFIKERPRHAGAHNYLAFAHRKLGRLDVAYKLYQKALELDPKHRGAQRVSGRTLPAAR